MSRLLRSTLLASAAIPLAFAMPVQADELSEMKAQLQALQKRIGELEARQAQAPAPQPEQAPASEAVTGGDFPNSFKLPGSDTSVKIGGYVRVDAVKQFGGDFGGTRSDATALAPLRSSGLGASAQDGGFGLTANRSRVNLETRTPTRFGTLRTYVEGDFGGGDGFTANTDRFNSMSFRLRHAYGEFGPLLGGQTYTTFFDPVTLPETLDPGGPAGHAGNHLRQAMVRITQPVGSGLLRIAAENPAAVFNGQAPLSGSNGTLPLVSVNQVNQYPDMTVRYDRDGDWGHVSVAGVLRNLRFDTGTSGTSSTAASPQGHSDQIAGGGALALRVPTVGKDNVIAVGAWGRGIGRYLWGANLLDAVTTAIAGRGGAFEPVDAFGGTLAYQHWWTENIRSNLVGGWVHNDIPRKFSVSCNPNNFISAAIAATCLPVDAMSAHVNLIWSPVPAANFGLEYEFAYQDWSSGGFDAARGGRMKNFGLGERLGATLQFGF